MDSDSRRVPLPSSLKVAVIPGGDAFVKPLDELRKERITRLFPANVSLHFIAYPHERCSLDDLTESIMASIPGEAVIAGISFGGLLALRIAESRPAILISSGPRFSAEGRARIEQQITALERGDVRAMAAPFVSLFRSPLLRTFGRVRLALKRPLISDPAYVIHMLRLALKCDSNGGRGALARASIIIGEHDQFFDIAENAIVIPRETHMLPIENPRAVRDALTEILRASSARA